MDKYQIRAFFAGMSTMITLFAFNDIPEHIANGLISQGDGLTRLVITTLVTVYFWIRWLCMA